METDFTAAQALRKSKEVGIGYSATADNLNYTLTLKRVLGNIKTASENGERKLAYVIPWFVIDGTTTNQNILAKQIKTRLVELGYIVVRDGHTLHIDWDLDLMEREAELERQRKARATKEKVEEKRRLRDIKRTAKYGKRPSKSIEKLGPPLASLTTGKRTRTGGFSVTKKRK